MWYQRTKERIYNTFEPSTDQSMLGRCVNTIIILLILLNVVAVVIGTMHGFAQRYHQGLYRFELISIIIFSAEYLLRLWSCTSQPGRSHPVRDRLRFALTPLAVIDLLAILPFFLPVLLPIDLRVLRTIRIFRILRILKIVRYSQSLQTLAHVFRKKRYDLLVTVIFASIILLIASSLIYAFENPVQPDIFPDIPSAMWWGVVTLTTVGYGDIYPITPIGKILGGLIAFLGIGMFALPAGILGSGFVEEMQQRRMQTGCCPHCGRPFSHIDREGTITADEQNDPPTMV